MNKETPKKICRSKSIILCFCWGVNRKLLSSVQHWRLCRRVKLSSRHPVPQHDLVSVTRHRLSEDLFLGWFLATPSSLLSTTWTILCGPWTRCRTRDHLKPFSKDSSPLTPSSFSVASLSPTSSPWRRIRSRTWDYFSGANLSFTAFSDCFLPTWP